MRLYVIKFGDLYFKSETKSGQVFTLELKDAKFFGDEDYLAVEQLATKIRGQIVRLNITEVICH